MRSTDIVVGTLVLFIIAACEAAAPPDGIVPEVVGRLEDARIREASGLARSQRQPGILWIINDNGAKEIVHAIDPSGGMAEGASQGTSNAQYFCTPNVPPSADVNMTP